MEEGSRVYWPDMYQNVLAGFALVKYHTEHNMKRESNVRKAFVYKF
jgi:hypothetical protein